MNPKVIGIHGDTVHIQQAITGDTVVAPQIRFLREEACDAKVTGRVEPSLEARLIEVCEGKGWSKSKGVQQAVILMVALESCGLKTEELIRHREKLAPIVKSFVSALAAAA